MIVKRQPKVVIKSKKTNDGLNLNWIHEWTNEWMEKINGSNEIICITN